MSLDSIAKSMACLKCRKTFTLKLVLVSSRFTTEPSEPAMSLIYIASCLPLKASSTLPINPPKL
jgi:hypothetical protein